MDNVRKYVTLFILVGIICLGIGIYLQDEKGRLFTAIGSSFIASSITSLVYLTRDHKKYIKKSEKILEIKQKFK